jgi:hypothetical protein
MALPRLKPWSLGDLPTFFAAIKQDASESATGVVELATTAEATTGTDTVRAVTPAGLAASLATAGRLKAVQVITASGTYSKPAGLQFVRVYVVGGGGGGAGAAATSSQASIGGGGGAGGEAIKKIAAASLAASETVTIGAAGAAGASGANAGGNGGTTSFGSHCSATGGTGGTAMGANTSFQWNSQVAGGVGSDGDINIRGQPGWGGFRSAGNLGLQGAGGSSRWGGGGLAVAITGSTAGQAGQGYGAGASGSGNANTQSAIAGAAGSQGVVIVEEYY